MKRGYFIGGTMGVGKTSVCQTLKKRLKNAVFLDGDWCWDDILTNLDLTNCDVKSVSLLNVEQTAEIIASL